MEAKAFRVVVIGCGTAEAAAWFKETEKVTLDLYTDPTGEIYQALALKRGVSLKGGRFSDLVGSVQNLWKHKDLRQADRKLQGGTFVIHQEGDRASDPTFVFEHREEAQIDHASFSDLEKALDAVWN